MAQHVKPGSDSDQQQSSSDGENAPHVRVAILGAGFAGLGMAIRLKRQGYDDFLVIEREASLGGTWNVNTYPGCACDIRSHLYSFSFAPNPDWTHAYPGQPEIKAYLCECAERFGISPHLRLNTTLRAAAWDDTARRWRLATSRGDLTADILILGQGPLMEPSLPAIPGIADFAGVIFHSARWNHDYDLTGKRVAVIGTGASAVQFVPQIQPKVSQLTLFQRTPAWIVPRGDHPIPARQRSRYREVPLTQWMKRASLYWRHELMGLGFCYWPRLLRAAEPLARRYLASQVRDIGLRAKLTPLYRMGCKRVLVSDDFYPALTRPNVEVITEAIREVRAHSVVTATGREHPVDAIICGTGFHVTDTRFAADVRGRDGRSLADHWRDGPSAYLGASVAGFPNLFLLTGPNTGLGSNSQVFMIECLQTYTLECLRQMDRQGVECVEVRREAQRDFNAEVQRRMRRTVWLTGCHSWYLDAHGRNTTLWPGFTFLFWLRTRHFDPRPFTLTRRAALTPALSPAAPLPSQ